MGAYEIIKDAASVLRDAGKIEQYRQLLEVYEKLLEMQNKISELESENKELRKQFEINEKLVPQDNAYYIENENKRDGPFCTNCWDSEKKLMTVFRPSPPRHNPGF